LPLASTAIPLGWLTLPIALPTVALAKIEKVGLAVEALLTT